MSGVQFSLAGYLTVYLVDAHGFSKTTAGTALSVAFASACIGRITWGWLSDRWFASHTTTLALIAAASVVLILGTLGCVLALERTIGLMGALGSKRA